ncbi:(3R)-hydroxyacyl-ACP dehydratase subunit HadC [Mycobacterium interjectum]|uniref:(3R)-hydroxyacyl-ACP dehydratase subunit HadC n=1 Tax=Mycobacterium interjectum TaxID=33895 RepID=UPI00082D48F0|nr:(3R)-hydroxyacyl-ACP dehydratase subunit HadC [Mycobacterium interjectum]MCV7090278.1 (3R)-hydroxyacyl-ACP dehydratase subunit HadC [Mycobacterium interjectum]
MALKTDVRGMSWKYPDYFEVGREQVRAFARAVKCDDPACFDEVAAAELGYDTLVAPLTFVSIFAKIIQDDFFRNVDVGMETMQIVQVDQQFNYIKPVLVGDKLFGRMDIESVNERFGADIVVTKNTCTNERGEVLLEAYTTLMGHEGDDSIQLRWDKETGQVVRTA